ncbi:MAG: hypothetical protein J5621_06725 [Paludibacteraceae bacterium]|nr:hypothetical protein [Paludibacteraceae bacterium]
MKRIVFFISIIMMLFASCASSTTEEQSKETDWNKHDLNGKVRKLTATHFYANIQNGRLRRKKWYWTEIFLFSEDGKILKNKNLSNGDTATYCYSYLDHCVVSKCFDTREVISIDSTFYTDFDKEALSVIYVLDTNKCYVEEGRTTYIYNEKQQLIEKRIDAYGDEDVIYYDEYNADGLLIKGHNYGPIDSTIFSYVYDAKGRVIKQVNTHVDGKKDYEHIRQYNNHGLVSLDRSTLGDYTSETKYTYKYDERGNYILKTTYNISASPDAYSNATIEERTIEYYE